MVTGRELVEKAREYIGTPFHHQGRVKGAGVDCIGLGICSLIELGFEINDQQNYPRLPRRGELLEAVKAHCDPIELSDAKMGDLLVFVFVKRLGPQHIGIVTEHGMMIHSWSKAKGVVEHNLDQSWFDGNIATFHSAWRYRGIE